MNVYFRNPNKSLGQIVVPLRGGEDYKDAILQSKEFLVQAGDGFDEPVLAVIDGGKHAL